MLAYRKIMPVEFLWGFIQFLWLLYDPLNKLSTSGSAFRQGAAGIERVLEVLDLEPTVRDAPDAIDLPRQSRVVELGTSQLRVPPRRGGASRRVGPGGPCQR